MNHGPIAALILFASLLAGCASDAIVIHQLKAGMTKSQVEKIQGVPANVEKRGDYTVLRYGPDYYVILEHDRVTSFGQGTISRYPGSDRLFINEDYQ